jgi:hypothetical protein
MNLTPGQLYFITEKDIIKGEKTEFYKIGIVRESDERNSKDRLLEHQTGNPRRLLIEEILTIAAVEAVETTLHYLFARNRVVGEWMKFNSEELAYAISKAKDLAKEVEKQLPIFERALKLEKELSNGANISSDEKALDLHNQASKNFAIINYCAELINRYKDYLNSANEKAIDISAAAKVQTRKGSVKFDAKMFSDKFPDLYKKYALPTSKWSQHFLLKNKHEFNEISELFNQEQLFITNKFNAILESGQYELNTIFELHEIHLGILEIQKYSEWQYDISIAELKVLTGVDEGIESICSWKRQFSEKIELNKNALQNDFPDQYLECCIESVPTEVLIVKPNIAEKF